MTDTMVLEPETKKDVAPMEAEGTKELEQRIQERAYEIFVESGFEHGHDLEHWLQAKAELSDKSKPQIKTPRTHGKRVAK
jgi:hypothetical protein